MKCTIGADPEVMLEKDGKFYSAIKVINYTKDKRKKIGKSYFYHDNVLAEFTIPAAKNKQEFISSIGSALKSLSEFVGPYNIKANAATIFDKDQIDCEEAYEISCDPEFCAYEIEKILPDDSLFRKMNLRTAGGHIHIGSKNLVDEEFDSLYCIKMMDLFLGTLSLFLDKDESSKLRKTFYGKAGRFRYPSYGVEYRSLSNFWLNSPDLCGFIYDVSYFVNNFVKEKKYLKYWEIDEEALKDVSNWKDKNFNQKNCHKCIGYDCDSLVNLINNHDTNNSKCEDFLKFIYDILPKNIVDESNRLIKLNLKDDIKLNWGY